MRHGLLAHRGFAWGGTRLQGIQHDRANVERRRIEGVADG
jgi:hypothetical protein